MARSRISDLLQNYPFWLIDVSPSVRPPFVTLGGPLYGFSEISHPEITIEQVPIPQVNQAFPDFTFNSASVGTISLKRGARFYDSSFFMWVDRYIQGEDSPERDLLLIQYMGQSLPGGNGVASGIAFGPSGVDIFRIPGKAWMLWGCKPIRWSAGPGLDAKSGEVTLNELDVQPVSVDEFSLDPFRIADAAGVV